MCLLWADGYVYIRCFFSVYDVEHINDYPYGNSSYSVTKVLQLLFGVPSKGLEKEMALHYSCLKNPMDRRAWWATAHEVAKSQTGLSY